MAECIYTVKDRQTGEILCRGTEKECAAYLGCRESYVRGLIRQQPEYKANTKYSKYKVERHGEVKRGGSRRKDVVCCDCGVLMKNVCVSRRRCPECARKHAREQNKQHMREVRNIPLAQPQIVNKNKEGCDGCKYFYGTWIPSCNYIFEEDKRRPCPPGKECTVKVRKRGKHEEEK